MMAGVKEMWQKNLHKDGHKAEGEFCCSQIRGSHTPPSCPPEPSSQGSSGRPGKSSPSGGTAPLRSSAADSGLGTPWFANHHLYFSTLRDMSFKWSVRKQLTYVVRRGRGPHTDQLALVWALPWGSWVQEKSAPLVFTPLFEDASYLRKYQKNSDAS